MIIGRHIQRSSQLEPVTFSGLFNIAYISVSPLLILYSIHIHTYTGMSQNLQMCIHIGMPIVCMYRMFRNIKKGTARVRSRIQTISTRNI